MGAITLEQAKQNAVADYDPEVIDEFRKSSVLLDNMIFDTAVNPAGGGATLTYGYRRLKTQRGADFRAFNHEYVDQFVTTETFNVDLTPLGGSFSVDRVLGSIGPGPSGELALQMQQLISATKTKFADAVINGDVAVDKNGFDGLDKALKDSSTEILEGADWSSFENTESAMSVLDDLDDLLGLLDGSPTMLFANQRVLAKVRAAARRASMYTQNPVKGLLGANGHEISRECYGNLLLVDLGTKAGSNDPIIPIVDGKSDIYAVRVGLDGFHAVTTRDGRLVRTWLPDFSTVGAVHRAECEFGPVAVVLKSSRAAAVLRGVKIAPSGTNVGTKGMTPSLTVPSPYPINAPEEDGAAAGAGTSEQPGGSDA